MGNLKQSEQEIELNLGLGLSLGGKFGVDKTPSPSPSNKLIRSSSIAGPPFPLTDHVNVNDQMVVAVPVAVPVPVPYPRLVRTSSLPVETEEEWRKRKEIQSLRRMAAKRRRSEKLRGVNVNVNVKEKGNREEYIADMSKVGSSATPQFGLPSWAAPAKHSILGLAIDALPNINAADHKDSQTHNNTLQGTSDGGDVRQANVQPVQDPNNQITVGSAGTQSGGTASTPSGPETDNSSKNLDDAAANKRKTELNSLEDMPSVFTIGDGPNGRRIEGILYRYGKGEDLIIMCVCHGDFHSPAEFVKHAGGTDTKYPLKHIVVNPNSLPA